MTDSGLTNYRPDLYGRVEGPTDAPEDIVRQALAIQCPDCLVNVFIERCAEDPTGYEFKIAHDAMCPWMARHEADTAAGPDH